MTSHISRIRSVISYRLAVEPDCGPMLAEEVLLDSVEDRGFSAVVQPQHHDPEARDEGLDQSWTHLQSSKVSDKLTPAPVRILTPKKLLIVVTRVRAGGVTVTLSVTPRHTEPHERHPCENPDTAASLSPRARVCFNTRPSCQYWS